VVIVECWWCVFVRVSPFVLAGAGTLEFELEDSALASII
jgi:hypothetical protein